MGKFQLSILLVCTMFLLSFTHVGAEELKVSSDDIKERQIERIYSRIESYERRIDRLDERIFRLEDLAETASGRRKRRIERMIRRIERRMQRSERRIERLERRLDRIEPSSPSSPPALEEPSSQNETPVIPSDLEDPIPSSPDSPVSPQPPVSQQDTPPDTTPLMPTGDQPLPEPEQKDSELCTIPYTFNSPGQMNMGVTIEVELQSQARDNGSWTTLDSSKADLPVGFTGAKEIIFEVPKADLGEKAQFEISFIQSGISTGSMVQPVDTSDCSLQLPEPGAEETLRKYAGETKICTHASYDGKSGVIEGPDAQKNRSEIVRHFNCVQPAVYAAWGGIWPENRPNDIANVEFSTKKLDEIVNWAKSEDLYVIHHMLIGKNFYHPQWFKDTKYSPAELDTLLQNYVRAVMTSNQNGTKIDAWNLINEVIQHEQGTYCTDGSGDDNCRWAGMGMEPDRSTIAENEKVVSNHPVFIRKMFEYAAQYTQSPLEIRDYGVEFTYLGLSDNPKTKLFYQLVSHLKNSGVRIDAAGVQAHFNVKTDNFSRSYDWENFKGVLDKFMNLGVEMYVTELDVGLKWDDAQGLPNYNWDGFEQQQGDTYYETVRAAREVGVSLISTWGFRDGSMGSWREGERAWILNEDYSRKIAYERYLQALKETF